MKELFHVVSMVTLDILGTHVMLYHCMSKHLIFTCLHLRYEYYKISH